MPPFSVTIARAPVIGGRSYDRAPPRARVGKVAPVLSFRGTESLASFMEGPSPELLAARCVDLDREYVPTRFPLRVFSPTRSFRPFASATSNDRLPRRGRGSASPRSPFYLRRDLPEDPRRPVFFAIPPFQISQDSTVLR